MSRANENWKGVRKYPLVEGKPTQPGRYWLWTPWIAWTEVRVGEGADPMVTSIDWPMSAWTPLASMTPMAVWRGPID
jgi:hypothetical protein